mmetsp:Transcript_28120/g.84050  ORF Transcript_28120/g.84050 Transcript_28120/m.84050 type:complete len:172 (+) Transcript_28120:1382-1897(+)
MCPPEKAFEGHGDPIDTQPHRELPQIWCRPSNQTAKQSCAVTWVGKCDDGPSYRKNGVQAAILNRQSYNCGSSPCGDQVEQPRVRPRTCGGTEDSTRPVRQVQHCVLSQQWRCFLYNVEKARPANEVTKLYWHFSTFPEAIESQLAICSGVALINLPATLLWQYVLLAITL